MKDLVRYLIDHRMTISSMESVTGGWFASSLTAVDGVSRVYAGSIVSYTNHAKIAVGQVDSQIIEKYGAISPETAEAMALNCQKIFNTDIAVSFTGNAGPTAQEGKPVGIIYTCICIGDSRVSYRDKLRGSREFIRNEIVDITVDRIKSQLGIKSTRRL